MPRNGTVARDVAMGMSYPSNDPPVAKSTTDARQGVTGHNVRYVLAISVVAAIIAVGVVWLSIAGVGG